MTLHNYDISSILFIDIETVPLEKQFIDLPQGLQDVLSKSYQKEIDRDVSGELTIEKLFDKYGGIKSEYSKIICIGLAVLRIDKDTQKLKLTKQTLGCENEHETEYDLLMRFAHLINEKYATKNLVFCGHNIQEFDIPFLCRRMLVSGITIPTKMNFQGKKPWEISILDTMKLWAFGDNKNFTSLDLLCRIFNIPTPKQELSGDKVKTAYYEEKAYQKIRTYCIADVVATAQLLLKLNLQLALLEDQIVSFVEQQTE